MLLKDYLLLNLGRLTLSEARRWQAEMAVRIRMDGSRDILAFWQPWTIEGILHPGQLVGFALFDPRRFMGELQLQELQAGLTEALREVLAGFGLEAAAHGSEVRVESLRDDGVLLGEVYMDLAALGELLRRELPPRQLSNAVAYFVEQHFGYAQSALHPVAFEEQMRPNTRS